MGTFLLFFQRKFVLINYYLQASLLAIWFRKHDLFISNMMLFYCVWGELHTAINWLWKSSVFIFPYSDYNKVRFKGQQNMFLKGPLKKGPSFLRWGKNSLLWHLPCLCSGWGILCWLLGVQAGIFKSWGVSVCSFPLHFGLCWSHVLPNLPFSALDSIVEASLS